MACIQHPVEQALICTISRHYLIKPQIKLDNKCLTFYRSSGDNKR